MPRTICTGERCPIQAGCINPSACRCTETCKDFTPVRNNVFEEECPNIYSFYQKTMLESYSSSLYQTAGNDYFWFGFMIVLVLVAVYDQKGRQGLRELEENYNKNPWNIETFNEFVKSMKGEN